MKPDSVDVLAPVLAKYKQAQEAQRILYVSFTSVVDYMWLLRATCECLAAFGRRAMLYLAAAVSDFYIPSDKMPTHKMQSGQGAPTISLQLVPKMLAPLVSLWVPHAFVVSFKLETDENLLISKSRESLNKYRHHLVIANLMQTRKHRVVFVTLDTSYEVVLGKEQTHSGLEIEEPIVADVVSVECSGGNEVPNPNQSPLSFRCANTEITWRRRTVTDKGLRLRSSISRL